MDYKPRQQAMKTTSPRALRIIIEHARRRAEDMHQLGWPLLAKSWHEDADFVVRRLNELEGKK